jgi:putative ABC transport system permease protein
VKGPDLAMFGGFVQLALRNLRGYPLRSLLTTLGVVFGIASVVTMLAMGRGAKEEILREIGRLGIRNVILNSVKPAESRQGAAQRTWISSYGLRFRDLAQIEETVPGVRRALPVHSYVEKAWEGSRNEEVLVLGVTPAYFEAAQLRVALGRGISDDDERERRAVCVVHLQLLRALGWWGEPLGFRLVVGEQVYEVVGVLEDEEFRGLSRKALASPEQRENEVFVPYATVLSKVGTLSFARRSGSFEASNVELNQILVEADDEGDVLEVSRMLRAVLERLHDQKDWEMVVPLELLAQRQRAQQVLDVALLLIAGISLLVGGIGIANIMLATVTERTREIGVRRAIGARRGHIVGQFLTETVILAGAGGLLGIPVGWAFTAGVRAFTSWEASFAADAAFVAIGVSCAVGVVSGLFPAWRASRLDPIQALRYQ